MEAGITEARATAMVRAAITKVGSDELKSRWPGGRPEVPGSHGGDQCASTRSAPPRPCRRVTKPQYRAILPYLAAVWPMVSDPDVEESWASIRKTRPKSSCWRPSRRFARTLPIPPIGVMLATVADDDMPASDVCFEIAKSDLRFGLADFRSPGKRRPIPRAGGPAAGRGLSRTTGGHAREAAARGGRAAQADGGRPERRATRCGGSGRKERGIINASRPRRTRPLHLVRRWRHGLSVRPS